ncbi:MAG: T6SS effector amidase Tae4 family protein [Kofleriaceae bacterium]
MPTPERAPSRLVADPDVSTVEPGAEPEAPAETFADGPVPPVAEEHADLPHGDEAFERMWKAHPHNYLPEGSEYGANTDSPQVFADAGLPDYGNSCATRLSVMLNAIGEPITPAKAKAAGVARRPEYSHKTGLYYILAASEMWTYLTGTFRAPDVTFPPKGRYQDASEFDAGFDSGIRPAMAGKHGIIAFDKIFSYGGTGHVDLFDGEQQSDGGPYQSQRVLIWYV